MSVKQISKGAKTLLKNTIQSSNFHNRKKEEEMMWKSRDLKYLDDNRGKRPLQNDSDDDDDFQSSSSSNVDKSIWMKKLLKAEAKQQDRWDHSGYKQLYPEEFNNSEDEISKSQPGKLKKLKKKSKKTMKKSKKKHKHKKHKPKCKHNKK